MPTGPKILPIDPDVRPARWDRSGPVPASWRSNEFVVVNADISYYRCLDRIAHAREMFTRPSPSAELHAARTAAAEAVHAQSCEPFRTVVSRWGWVGAATNLGLLIGGVSVFIWMRVAAHGTSTYMRQSPTRSGPAVGIGCAVVGAVWLLLWLRATATFRRTRRAILLNICPDCGYLLDLSHPALPLGPEHCPECGVSYPAVPPT